MAWQHRMTHHRKSIRQRVNVDGIICMCAADVTMKPVDWLWAGRLARGKLSLLAGRPDLGKSLLTLDITARITTGAALPDGGRAPLGSVLILSAEDAPDDTLSHPAKAAQAEAINNVTGSLAFVAAARISLLAIKEPGTDRRLLLSVKNNLRGWPDSRPRRTPRAAQGPPGHRSSDGCRFGPCRK
jgi:hypothetical protein